MFGITTFIGRDVELGRKSEGCKLLSKTTNGRRHQAGVPSHDQVFFPPQVTRRDLFLIDTGLSLCFLDWKKSICYLFLLTWRWIFLSLKSRGTDFVTFLGDLGKEQKFEVNRLLVLTMLDHARHQHGDHAHPPGDLRRGGGEVRRRPHPVSCPALHTSSGGARDLYPPKKLASISIYQVCYGVGTDGKTAHNDAARWLFCIYFSST